MHSITCEWMTLIEQLTSTLLFSLGSLLNLDTHHIYFRSDDTCAACPEHTRRYPKSLNDVAGVSITQCLCKPGYYAPGGSAGAACRVCPVGGVCDGGLAAPYPARGFYGLASVPIPAPDGPNFIPCPNLNACAGGANFTCGEGWRGARCATPAAEHFAMGPLSVECPRSLDLDTLRFGGRRTELCTVCVLVAALIVLLVLLRVVVRSHVTPSESTAFGTWHCLQLLALTSRLGLVPWPPALLASLRLVGDVALLDLRPLARLALGCGFLSTSTNGLVVGSADAFFAEWGLNIVVLGGAALLGRKLPVRLMCVASPLLALAAFETLSCQRFPDGMLRLRAAPSVECWANNDSLHAMAAIVAYALISLLFWVLVGMHCGPMSSRARAFDLFWLCLAAAGVTFGADDPTEVAVATALVSSAKLAWGYPRMHSATSTMPKALRHLAVTAFALASWALLSDGSERAGRGKHYWQPAGLEEWSVVEWGAIVVAVLAFGVPALQLGLVKPLQSGLGRLLVLEEAQQATRTRAALSNFESVQLVVVRCNGLLASSGKKKGGSSRVSTALRDANPRLVITAMTPEGTPLVRSSGRLNSRVLSLNAQDLQPSVAHCLTYCLADDNGSLSFGHQNVSGSACFSVELVDLAQDGVDQVVCRGSFRVSLAEEGQVSVSVPLRTTPHAWAKRHHSGTVAVSCVYSVPGELLASRRQFRRHPVLRVLQRLCLPSGASIAAWCRGRGRRQNDNEGSTKALAKAVPPVSQTETVFAPLALAQHAANEARMPQDQRTLRAALEYLQPQFASSSEPASAAAASLVSIEARFMDMVAAEAESEEVCAVLHKLLATLNESAEGYSGSDEDGSRGSKKSSLDSLPVDGAFLIDWLVKCRDPLLLDAARDLFNILQSSSNASCCFEACTNPPPPPAAPRRVHAGKNPEEEAAEIELLRVGQAAEAAQLNVRRRAAEEEGRTAARDSSAAVHRQPKGTSEEAAGAAAATAFEEKGIEEGVSKAPPARLQARLQVSRAPTAEDDEASATWPHIETQLRDAGQATSAWFGSMLSAFVDTAPLPPPDEEPNLRSLPPGWPSMQSPSSDTAIL